MFMLPNENEKYATYGVAKPFVALDYEKMYGDIRKIIDKNYSIRTDRRQCRFGSHWHAGSISDRSEEGLILE